MSGWRRWPPAARPGPARGGTLRHRGRHRARRSAPRPAPAAQVQRRVRRRRPAPWRQRSSAPAACLERDRGLGLVPPGARQAPAARRRRRTSGRRCWCAGSSGRRQHACAAGRRARRRAGQPRHDLASGRPSACSSAAAMRQGSRAATSPPGRASGPRWPRRRQRAPCTHSTSPPQAVPSVPRPTPSSASPITGIRAGRARPSPPRCAHGGAAPPWPARPAGGQRRRAGCCGSRGAGRAPRVHRPARASACSDASSARRPRGSPGRHAAATSSLGCRRRAGRRVLQPGAAGERAHGSAGFMTRCSVRCGQLRLSCASSSAAASRVQPVEPGVHADAGAGRHQQHLDGRVDAPRVVDAALHVEVQVRQQVGLVQHHQPTRRRTCRGT
jgi:hypothetical protein